MPKQSQIQKFYHFSILKGYTGGGIFDSVHKNYEVLYLHLHWADIVPAKAGF